MNDENTIILLPRSTWKYDYKNESSRISTILFVTVKITQLTAEQPLDATT